MSNKMGGYRTGRRWTEEDFQFLKENYTSLGPAQCAKTLGASYHSTQAQARKLGLRMFRSKPWSKEDVEFLKENFPTKLTAYCAKKLGRTWDATHKKANSLGL